MAAAAKLELVADEESFFFRPPPGEPLQLHTFANKKQESLQHLLQHRYPLSEVLQKRIKKHEKNRSSGGLIVQVLFGLLLPSGMLTQGGWDYDRDMAVLQKEAAVVLSAHFPPSEFELQEHIDSEASFKSAGGKVLFTLYIS